MHELMVDIRDRVIRIETRMEDLPALKAEVKKHDQEILKAKTSVKVLRWAFGILFITLPATAYAILKIYKS